MRSYRRVSSASRAQRSINSSASFEVFGTDPDSERSVLHQCASSVSRSERLRWTSVSTSAGRSIMVGVWPKAGSGGEPH